MSKTFKAVDKAVESIDEALKICTELMHDEIDQSFKEHSKGLEAWASEVRDQKLKLLQEILVETDLSGSPVFARLMSEVMFDYANMLATNAKLIETLKNLRDFQHSREETVHIVNYVLKETT